ncbi:FAD-binding domain-containing protein [Suillus spraguei]|nr:FAD-binding domain-containing protein [Suillus spraguei]
MTLLQVPLSVISGLINLFTSTGLWTGSGVDYNATCQEIAASVSSASNVYYYGSPQFGNDTANWSFTNSQNSTCSFEPANAQDVGIALQILGVNRTPFGVKGGGHSPNPGFSSTLGVQIAMRLFSEVVYDQNAQTVTFGMGLVWEDVYSALLQYNVTVVGGRSFGVGVGGFVLGGGYSFISNEYGLSVDNIVSLELVLPNGQVTNVTKSSNPGLFYALRGGFNNFGIVATVTMKAHPQSEVWGGLISYAEAEWDAFNNATVNMVSTVTDPKAAVYISTDYVIGEPTVITAILFYDGPNPGDIYDDFLAIPSIEKNISTRTFVSLAETIPLIPSLRIVTFWVAVEEFTLPMLVMIQNQTVFYGNLLLESSAVLISYDLVPLLPSLYNHSEAPSAFPSLRGPDQGHSFIEIIYGWTNESYDEVMLQAGTESAAYMKQFAVDAGQNVSNALQYPNAAAPGTPLVNMYSQAALDKLGLIRIATDPSDVMGLAGGWKF